MSENAPTVETTEYSAALGGQLMKRSSTDQPQLRA